MWYQWETIFSLMRNICENIFPTKPYIYIPKIFIIYPNLFLLISKFIIFLTSNHQNHLQQWQPREFDKPFYFWSIVECKDLNQHSSLQLNFVTNFLLCRPPPPCTATFLWLCPLFTITRRKIVSSSGWPLWEWNPASSQLEQLCSLHLDPIASYCNHPQKRKKKRTPILTF